MNRFLSALILLLSCSFASAQPVQQSGSITPGHPVMWNTNGVVKDAGTAVNGFLTGVGVTAPGKGVCVNSGPVTGPYQQLCLSVTTGGPGQIILQNFGGAAPQNLQAVINGVAFNLPGGGGGGAVNSVSNSDSTLTISPTTGVVVASLNLANANTWTATQTFPQIIDTGVSGGGTVCLQADNTGKITSFGAGCGGGGGGAVNSVSNADGTLTISPTSGAVVASLNTGHANTWSAVQTFNANDLLLAGVTGSVQCLHANSSGVVTGTGSDCGAGGGGGVTSVSNSDGTLTISPITGAVVASINLGHSNTWVVDQTFQHVLFAATAANGINDQSAVSGSTGSFWPSNGPAIVHRMNRQMVGVAASGNLSPGGNTWMDALTGNFSELANITVLGTIFSGINAASRTSDTVAAGIGTPSGGSAGGYFFGYNDDNTIANIALGTNSVGVAKAGTRGITLGAQQDMNNAAVTCVPTPNTPECTVGVSSSMAILATAGAFASLATQPVTAAIEIQSGGNQTFNAGILFQTGSLNAGVGPSGLTIAIELPHDYSIIWYNGSTAVASMTSDPSGNVEISGAGCLKFNGTCITVP